MNWKLILLLPLIGLILGVMELFGLGGAIGLILGLVAVLVIALLIGKFAPRRYFLHGLLTGLLTGAIPPILRVIFSGMYIENNPEVAERLAAVPPEVPVAALLAIGIPIGAVFMGVLIGLVSN